MLFVIDVGNTNITYGLYKGDDLVLVARSATQRNRTSDEFAADIYNLFALHRIEPTDCTGLIVSSVVPEISNAVCDASGFITGCEPILLNSSVKTGLKIVTDNPAELGADMASGSVAVKELYPLPAVVADLGTATKLYALDENGAFVGCTIAAGVRTSLSALSSGASQLPAISIVSPPKAVCTSTVECMQSGAVIGSACLIDGMISRFEKELGYKFKSKIATGGYSKVVIPQCENPFTIDFDLVLKGLKVIYRMNCRQALERDNNV